MRRTGTAAAIVSALFLLLAGCSGGKEAGARERVPPADVTGGSSSCSTVAGEPPAPRQTDAASASLPQSDGQTVKPSNCQTLRKEFVVVREIVRQHSLQQGNEKRMEAIEAALKSKFPLLPDKGETEEEKRVYRDAEELSRTLSAR